MSARTFLDDLKIVEETVRKMIDEYNLDVKNSDAFKTVWEKLLSDKK